MTASGWVPCESLTKRTPSTIATGSRRCSTPAERRGRRPDRLRRDAEEPPDGDGGEGIADVVAAGDRQLRESA